MNAVARTLRLWPLLGVIALFACADDGTSTPPDPTDALAEDAPDAAADVREPEDARPDIEPEDTTPGPTPDELFCRPCDISADCGDGNYCLSGFPGETQFCAADCVLDPTICPERTTCTDLAAGGLQRACVPDELIECPCFGVACDAPLICDPFAGACAEPLDNCEPCEGNEQCGEGNFCLQYQVEGGRIETGCATRCDGLPCPEGYDCLDVGVGEGDPVPLCVPEIRTCVDRCEGVTCDEATEYCDPTTGACLELGEMCAPCAADYQCGGVDDRCLGLAGPPCERNQDCRRGETCSADGQCIDPVCGVACDPDSGDLAQCPPGGACFLVDAATREGQCLPLRLSCADRCASVTCDDGENCDDRTGECVPSEIGICSQGCTENAACGGYDDMCIALERETRCLFGCGETPDGRTLSPCPVGYGCFELYSGLSFCVPQNEVGDCRDCSLTACPDGESCYPVDAACYPTPQPCSADAPECGLDARCNLSEGRCEPIGTACRYEDRFFACDINSMVCTAPTEGVDGTCEESCFTNNQCPVDRPYCRNFHGAITGVCTGDPIGGAHECGQLANARIPFGEPCTVVDDPTDPTLCSSPSATLCLEGIDPTIGGVCTRECTTDEDCGDARCLPIGDGAYCLPDACACAAPPALLPGEVDELGALLARTGTSRCAATWSTVERRTLLGVLATDDPYRIPIVAPAQGDPLGAAQRLDEAIDRVTSAVGAGDLFANAVRLAADAWQVPLRGEVPQTAPVADGVLRATLETVANELLADPPPTGSLDALDALDDALEAQLAEVLLRYLELVSLHTERFAPAVRAGADVDAGSLAGLVFPGETALAWTDEAVRFGLGSRDLHTELVALASELRALIEALPESVGAAELASTVRLDTPQGAIVFAGTGDDTHRFDTPPALVFELGGNDTYVGPVGANDGIGQAASIVVDFGGADSYGYDAVEDPLDTGLLPSDGAGRATPVALGNGPVSRSEVARQGAGRFGVGAVIDLGAGRDEYRSLRFSQGFGLVGVGLLLDEEGDASLVLEAAGQGAGVGGLGVLILGDGGATVRAAHGAMGYGGPGGVGVVVGGLGADDYQLDPSTEDGALYFDNATRGSEPLSAGLGAGVGVLSPDGRVALAGGGLGVLIERGGNDRYEAGALALGAGVFHGGGWLRDASGDDVYLVARVGLGAGERSGVGVFEDALGDDRYGDEDAGRTAFAAAGTGQDLGVGVFIDRDGNDVHAHSFRSMGFGQLNGFGLFWDAAGDDRYYADANESMGQAVLTILGSEPADNPRRSLGTFGWFLDTGGRDDYDRPDLLNPPLGDESTWLQVSRDEAGLPTYGGGFDGVGGTGL
jgi:hypothetical protein